MRTLTLMLVSLSLCTLSVALINAYTLGSTHLDMAFTILLRRVGTAGTVLRGGYSWRPGEGGDKGKTESLVQVQVLDQLRPRQATVFGLQGQIQLCHTMQHFLFSLQSCSQSVLSFAAP